QRFVSRLEVFSDLFTRPTWSNVLVLLGGAILAPGRRTVTATLRILGLERDPQFCTFHRILNRACWSSRSAAGRLLLLLISILVPRLRRRVASLTAVSTTAASSALGHGRPHPRIQPSESWPEGPSKSVLMLTARPSDGASQLSAACPSATHRLRRRSHPGH